MKRLIAAIFTILVALGYGIETQAQEKGMILPGKGKINVEKLNKKIDTNMDISQLSLSELRVLRNAFAARQGYCFKDATLRSIFKTTSWYEEKMYNRWNKEEGGDSVPYRYSKSEMAFIEKIKAREKELSSQNFQTEGNNIVNTNNIINPFQLEENPPELMDKLGQHGFAIVPALHNQLFQVYEKNDYSDFPSFITTDLFLQLYHLYFDCVLREAEQHKMIGMIESMCKKYEEYFSNNTWDEKLTYDAAWCKTFFAVAEELLKCDKVEDVSFEKYNLSSEFKNMAQEEIIKVYEAQNDFSAFMEPDYTNVMFAYSLFRPRGHYNGNETLRRYFRAMMWLQTVPMAADYENQVRRAIMMGMATKEPAIASTYQQFSDAITYLMGRPDNVTIQQIGDEWAKRGASILNDEAVRAFAEDIKTLAENQIRIRPIFENTSRYKINLMPQRYQPDGEVMLKMVDGVNIPSQREDPDGLDIMASMGMNAAEDILINELKEVQKWQGYKDALSSAKHVMNTTDWQATITNQWLQTLTSLDDTNAQMPYFMQTKQWQKKALNSALASWAELKHDAILYAKQPMMAECGGGGPEDPVVKGYVEPNVVFWTKAIALLDETSAFFESHNLQTEKAKNVSVEMHDLLEFCKNISEKELQGKELSEEEYNQIEIMGSNVEYLSIDLLRQPDQFLEWNDITSTDKKVALVADVFTSNGQNVENKNILYAGTGPAYEIYVVVEIGGKLYLTRGAVLSYRQFREDIGSPRMTDEEWQEQLKTRPGRGVPTWMEEITVPMKSLPADNEEVFYSSGC